MQRSASAVWLPYVAAIVAVTLSSLLPVMFTGLDTRFLVVIYFTSVVFAAWYGGLGPALVATVLAYLAANLFFLPARNRFTLDYGTVTFLLACLSVAALSEAMTRARRRAEASAQRVVAIVESITDGFLTVDRHGRCTYLNRAAEDLSQLDRAEAVGRRPEDVFPIIADPLAQAKLRRAAVDRVTAEFESFYEPWKRWLELKASPAEAGSLAILIRDVTERKLAEIGLAKSEERLRYAQHGARAGLWDRDLTTGKIAWSDMLYEIHGIDRATEPAIESLLGAVHPLDRERVSQSIEAMVREGTGVDMEYRTVPGAEGIRWVAARGQAILDGQGRAVRTSGIVLDITERKRAEESLRFLSEAGTVLANLVDFESTIQRVANLAVKHFADWCVIDMLSPAGQTERIAFAHRDAEKSAPLKELLEHYVLAWGETAQPAEVSRTGQPQLVVEITPRDLDTLGRDEQQRRLLHQLGPASLIIVPLLVRNRGVGTITFVSADPHNRYTTRELDLASELARRVATAGDNARLYSELREAQRQKDDFLAMLAHELRNPIAAIQYANQVAKLADKEGNPAAEVIDRQVKNLAHLIDDLLDVSRITRDKIQLRKEQVDGGLLLDRAVATVRPDLEARRHQLVVDRAREPLPLHVDPVRVEQILVNLLSNAAKYTPEGGRITVRSYTAAGQAVFKVKDTGIGIPVEMLPRVFELFTQVDRSLDRAQGGLGIGLTVVRKLAEMHGGSVSVASEGTGRGSEFTVRLPLSEAGAQAPGSTPLRPSARSLKILVVDDNVDMARSIATLLDKMGHTVSTAHDGPAALQSAREHSPEVILLDIGLPGLDGYRVAETLRREPELSHVRLIAVSGYGQAEDRQRAQEAGFDLHLVKPVDLSTLVSAISGSN